MCAAEHSRRSAPTPSEIVAHREALRLSQVQYARLLKINRSTLRTWEDGTQHPNRRVGRLIQVMNMQPSEALAELDEIELRRLALLADPARQRRKHQNPRLQVLLRVEADVTAELEVCVGDWAMDPLEPQHATNVLSMLASALRELADAHGWSARIRVSGRPDTGSK
jgi:DNA-binding XRE family transcriptional regulator